jgi:hypothetical protein
MEMGTVCVMRLVALGWVHRVFDWLGVGAMCNDHTLRDMSHQECCLAGFTPHRERFANSYVLASWVDRYVELGLEGSKDAHFQSILSLTGRRFLHSCRLLPSYLVAAFIKRSMRLALRATPAGIAFVMPFAYNLLLKHPQCMPMLHRERSQGKGCEKLSVDDCTSFAPAPLFWDVFGAACDGGNCQAPEAIAQRAVIAAPSYVARL